MAKLTPNAVYTMNGVTISEKIIPDGTRWKDGTKAKKAGFSAGRLYKKQQKLSGGTGKVQFVTIHNTNGVNPGQQQLLRTVGSDGISSMSSDAERYFLAVANISLSYSR